MAVPLSCDQCEELLADYLLRALETEILSAVTEHLSTCDRCQAHLAAYEAVLDQLGHAVPRRAAVRVASCCSSLRTLTPCSLCKTSRLYNETGPTSCGWGGATASGIMVGCFASMRRALV